MSILDSFVAYGFLDVVGCLFTLCGETTTNDIAKTHVLGNRLNRIEDTAKTQMLR